MYRPLVVPLLVTYICMGLSVRSQNALLRLGHPERTETISGITSTPQGAWVLCGYTDAFDGTPQGDAILIQLDSHLSFEAAVSIGTPYEDMLIDIQQDFHRGYYAVGWTKSSRGDYDGWIVRLGEALDTVWMIRIGGTSTDQLWTVLPTFNGCIAIGSTRSWGSGQTDAWVLFVDSSGTVYRNFTYGSTSDDAPENDYEEAVARGILDSDGRLVITSLTNAFDNDLYHIWLAIIDTATGDILYQYAYPHDDESSAWHIGEMPSDRGYLLPGTLVDPESGEARLWLAHLDTSGRLLQQQWYDFPNHWEEVFYVYTTRKRCFLAAYLDDGRGKWRSLLLGLRSVNAIDFALAFEMDKLDWLSAVTADVGGNPVWVGVTTDTVRWNMDVSIARITDVDPLHCTAFQSQTLYRSPANLSLAPLSFVKKAHPIAYLPVHCTIEHADLPTTWYCRPTKTKDIPTGTSCNERSTPQHKTLTNSPPIAIDVMGHKIKGAPFHTLTPPLLYLSGLRGSLWGRLHKQKSICPERR